MSYFEANAVALGSTLLVLGACSASRHISMTCQAVGSHCRSDAGLRPELDPACNGDLAPYRQESWAKLKQGKEVVVHVAPPGHGVQAVLHMPPEDRGELATTIWLDPDEDLRFDFEVAWGTQDEDPGAAYATLLLDGLVQDVDEGTGPEHSIAFELHPGGVASRSASVASDAIPLGGHSATLLFWTEGGRPMISYDFTLLKGSTLFVQRPPALSTEIQKIVSSLHQRSTVTAAGVESLLDARPDADGKVTLGFLITPVASDSGCPQLPQRSVVVAFLDNVQVPLGELGLRPGIVLREGQGAAFSAVVQALPPQAAGATPHVFQIWQLEGDGEYADAPPGSPSLWAMNASQIGQMVW